MKRAAQQPIEVKLLRSRGGKVIFLESGPDFVELMFGIMNAPLSSLLASSGPKRVQDHDLHPLASLKESLYHLGPQSFVSGKKSSAFMPETRSMEQLAHMTTSHTLSKKSSEEREPSAKDHFANIVFNGGPGPYLDREAQLQRQRIEDAKRDADMAASQHILKDNCKFMVTDTLEVFESSTVTAMELMKEHADDFRGIQTSTEMLTLEHVKKFIMQSMLGSKTVLTDVFEMDWSCAESDGSFEAVDHEPPQKGKFKSKGKGKGYWA